MENIRYHFTVFCTFYHCFKKTCKFTFDQMKINITSNINKKFYYIIFLMIYYNYIQMN